MTKLSIIVLNYNTKDLTLQCLKSIQEQYGKQLKSGEFEIVIVDNNSTDGSAEAVQKMQKLVQHDINPLKIIRNDENVGFSKGNNIGAVAARGRYLLFLNSDTEFKDDNLQKALEFLDKNNQIGILGIKMNNPDGFSQLSCGIFFNFFNTCLLILGGERFGLMRFTPKKTEKVDWVSGGAMIIKKDLFNKLNGFDKNFFMYVEDMELCFRAKREGFLTYFYPYVSVVHKELGSSSRTYAILNIYKGVLYFYIKHKSVLEYLLIKTLFRLKAILAVLIGTFTRNLYLVNTYKQILNGL